jgi:hypothetical protein
LLLAERLSIRAVDLDRLFAERAGDISQCINRFGYDVYARQNVETYRLILQEGTDGAVVALSSGFMTYSRDIHPDYPRLRRDIEQSPTTFVLIPSLIGSSVSPRLCVGAHPALPAQLWSDTSMELSRTPHWTLAPRENVTQGAAR